MRSAACRGPSQAFLMFRHAVAPRSKGVDTHLDFGPCLEEIVNVTSLAKG